MSSDTPRSELVPRLARLTQGFAVHVPHNKALGMTMVSCQDSEAIMSLEWREDLVGDPQTGVLHGGVITALLDACSGAATFMALSTPRNIATLDLRVDYLRPATPRARVYARATCFRMTREIAFVRGLAYHELDGAERHIATSMASFMVGLRKGRPTQEANR